MAITLTNLIANDAAGTLTIGYQLSVTDQNGKKTSSTEKFFVLSGFSTSADTPTEWLNQLNPTWATTGADRTMVQPDAVTGTDQSATTDPGSLFKYVTFSLGNGTNPPSGYDKNHVQIEIINLIPDNDKGTLMILFTLSYVDPSKPQVNPTPVYKTHTLTGFYTNDQARAAELAGATISFQKKAHLGRVYASSLFNNHQTYQPTTDQAPVLAALEITGQPSQTRVEITNATVDNQTGVLTLTYQIVSLVRGSGGAELKSPEKTAQVNGFLNLQTDLNEENTI